MNNQYIKNLFKANNNQAIDQAARDMIARVSHEKIKELSGFSHAFAKGLSETQSCDAKYLSLAFKVSKYLSLVAEGACPCIIVKQNFHNPVSRVKDLFSVEEINSEPYEETYKCICKACKKPYSAKNQQSGFGSKVIWNTI